MLNKYIIFNYLNIYNFYYYIIKFILNSCLLRGYNLKYNYYINTKLYNFNY